MNAHNTPILILVFNRPDKVRQLLAALAIVRPTKLYVSADGPRDTVPLDVQKCAEVRSLFQNIPWECEVYTNFSPINKGCRNGPESGIDWFFTHVEAGIILEDDCIPHPSFFDFCSTLLHKYQNDPRIMHISGNNFQNGMTRGDGSYYFSLYTHSWGWATWRRAWQKYQPALEQFAEFDSSNRIKQLPLSRTAQRFWIKNFRYTIKRTDSWDSLWQYTVWLNKGLAIIPNKNLVSNIGFDTEATHTTQPNATSHIKTEAIDFIQDPSSRTVQTEADDYTFDKHFYVSLPSRVLRKINDILT